MFLVRHGESVANRECTVVGTREEGEKPRWGLTELGQEQAEQAGKEIADRLRAYHPSLDASELLLITSPFSRARQTADGIRKAAGATETPRVDDRLVERYFGAHNELRNAIDVYHSMRDGDAHSLLQPPVDGAECAADVAKRVSAALADALSASQKRAVCIVSHGCASSHFLKLFS